MAARVFCGLMDALKGIETPGWINSDSADYGVVLVTAAFQQEGGRSPPPDPIWLLVGFIAILPGGGTAPKSQSGNCD